MSSESQHVEDVPFTKQMRIATRDIHSLSDALVNAKLGFAASDNAVWADGLLVFYDIFSFLEGAMDRLGASLVGSLDIEGMRRKEAFESDLCFYLGADWKASHVPRPAVQSYLDHLETIERDQPHLIMAYIYHLYMGLLSGGQILRKKRLLLGRFFGGAGGDDAGNAVTNYGGYKIRHLKTQLAAAINDAAMYLDDETKGLLIEESRQVFVRNNEIVGTVKGTHQVIVRKLMYVLIAVVFLFVCYWILFM